MPCLGNAASWVDIFPSRFVPKILELVVKTWAEFEKPAPHDLEVPITSRFIQRLIENKNFRRLPFRIDDDYRLRDSNGVEIARIDITFNSGHREDVYFAFECKRLRIPYSGRIRSNTSAYVGCDGMERFTSGKYGRGQPSAGMIAYVMDRKRGLAVTAIRKKIQEKKDTLCLIPDTYLCACKIAQRRNDTLVSEHKLTTGNLTIYHLLFDI